MSEIQFAEILREGVFVAIKVAGPMLLLSMVAGIIVAIFQAVTQIHEQSLAFTLKLIMIIIVLVFYGGSMMETLLEYCQNIFALMQG